MFCSTPYRDPCVGENTSTRLTNRAALVAD